MKILVIEDEVKTAKFLKKGLSEAGYVIDVAADDFSTPLQLLAQRIEFDDPLSGTRREFVSSRRLEGQP